MPYAAAVTLARRCTRWVTAQRERGSASLQMIMVLPVVLTIFTLGLQAALLYQGRALSIAAAQEGARAAAAEHGTASIGISTAETYLATSTAGLSGTSVTGTRGATSATITVSTTTTSVIPFVNPRIVQSASMPIERLTSAPAGLLGAENPPGTRS